MDPAGEFGSAGSVDRNLPQRSESAASGSGILAGKTGVLRSNQPVDASGSNAARGTNLESKGAVGSYSELALHDSDCGRPAGATQRSGGPGGLAQRFSSVGLFVRFEHGFVGFWNTLHGQCRRTAYSHDGPQHQF